MADHWSPPAATSAVTAAPAPFAQEVIRPFDAPIYPVGGLAVLRGNLCPDGAVIKPSAAAQTTS